MLIFDEDRASDSPYVERVWCSRSERAGWFVSIAESRTEIVFTGHTVTIRGPETKATRCRYPAGAEWLGIRFKPGVSLRPRPARELVNGTATLPEASDDSFLLDSSAWRVPHFDEADTFVERLARSGLLAFDPAVRDALQGEAGSWSPRTLQRRFLHATGITQSTVRQIERARYAAILLRDGTPVTDAALQAGYFDQPHLTRAMRHFIGSTPAALTSENWPGQMSFLYKTRPFPGR